MGSSAHGRAGRVASRPLGLHTRPAVPTEPDLFAAPLVADRASGWVLLGFRNTEPKGVLAFDLLDPTPVRRDGDALVLR